MDDKNAERLPPQSIGAEKCLLGALLRDNSILADVQAVIRGKEDFYLYANQLVWDGICAHAEKGKPFDPRIIADWLNEKKVVEDVGYAYLAELWDAAPSAGNAVHYAETVQDRATRRRLIHIGNEVASRGFNLNEPISTIAQAIEQKLFAATQQSFKTNLRPIRDSMKDALEELDRRAGKAKNGEADDSILTPWFDLNELTGGYRASELIVMAARPSVGKTLKLLNQIRFSGKQGKRVFFASLEQGDVENNIRLLCMDGLVSSRVMRKGNFNEDEYSRVLTASEALSETNIWMDGTPFQTAAMIASSARRLHMRMGLDLVCIDYLGLMESPDQYMKKHEAVGFNAKRMKQLARELKVPVILLAQLNREVEQRAEPRPKLSDLRDSGEIEQHADTVIMLWKEAPPDDKRENDILRVGIEKQRNGPCGDVSLLHRKKFFDIQNLTT
jgi:replicative DNA helicase